MSKVARQIVLILAILVVGVFLFAGYTLIEKQRLIKEKDSLEKQIEEFQNREKKYVVDNKALQDKLNDVEKAKAKMEERLKTVDADMEALNTKIKQLTQERDEWQKRVDEIKKERDDLLVKVQEKPEPQIVYKYIEKEATEEEKEGQVQPPEGQGKEDGVYKIESVTEEDESYWADVLKGKAALALEVEKLTEELSKSSVEVVELKKQNSDLQLELSSVKNQKEGIERDIKYGKDLSDTLSLELARSKNDNKFLNNRIGKLNEENNYLREQMKQLTSTKIALEKSIVRLQDEKKEVEKKLLETENVIQSRIDEIWQIKESLDKSFQTTKPGMTNEIELPPIIVSAQESGGESTDESRKETGPGFQGNVVSVNEENNFVILDLGEAEGIKIGDALSVYRGTEFVAALEVIQVRKDIAAADIKNKVAKILIGDEVR